MTGNANGIFFIIIGILFILLGTNLFFTIPEITFKPFGIIFIAVGAYIIKNRNISRNSAKNSKVEDEEAARKAGQEGEKAVSYALDWLNKNKYFVFNNIDLKCNGISQQFDHLVIGINGIFNIETKAYSGKIIIDKYGNWAREKTGKVEPLENPLFQIQRHHKTIEGIIGESHPIIDTLVLANKNVLIEGIEKSPLNIVKADTLQYFIENYKSGAEIPHEELIKIKDIIKAGMSTHNTDL